MTDALLIIRGSERGAPNARSWEKPNPNPNPKPNPTFPPRHVQLTKSLTCLPCLLACLHAWLINMYISDKKTFHKCTFVCLLVSYWVNKINSAVLFYKLFTLFYYFFHYWHSIHIIDIILQSFVYICLHLKNIFSKLNMAPIDLTNDYEFRS